MSVGFKFLENVSVESELRVVLGVQTFRLFLCMPDNFHYVGIIKFGMEFGLLARDSAGDYFRINGSDIEKLSAPEVDTAIQLAKTSMRMKVASQCSNKDGASRKLNSPSVLQKKYRKIDPALATKKKI